MSEVDNSPALRDILRALGTGESFTGKQIFARTLELGGVGRTITRPQYRKAIELGLLSVDDETKPMTFTLTDAGMDYVRDAFPDSADGVAESSRRLSETERKALLAMLTTELRIANAEIVGTVGLKISDGVRTSLQNKGLVTVTSEGSGRRRRFYFELTEKGWLVAEQELSRLADADDKPATKLMHQITARLLADIRAQRRTLVDVYADDYFGKASAPRRPAEIEPTTTVGARVIDGYEELVYEPGGWVMLTRLRDHLADIDREELDEVLSALFRDGRIKLISEVNQRALTDQDRSAAISIGGDHKHLYSVG